MPATPGRWPSRWKSGRSLPNRIVVAYSGTLNSSIAVAWLKERHGGEVIAVTLDVGQGRELSQIRERAMAAGANRCHVLDVREEFIREFVLRTLQADALQGQRDGHMLPWAVRDLASNTIVGTTRYHDIVAAIEEMTRDG